MHFGQSKKISTKCQNQKNAIPEKQENDQEQGSNNTDKSEQNLTICKENDKNL